MTLIIQTHVRDRTNDGVIPCPPPVFSVSPRLGGSLEETSSARPFRGSGTGVTVLTGVSPMDASFSNSY